MDEYKAILGEYKISALFPYSSFRDYDAEWAFIKQMDQLGDMHFSAAIQVEGDNAKMLGLPILFIGKAANGNLPNCS